MILAIDLEERFRSRLVRAANRLGREVRFTLDVPARELSKIDVLLYWSTSARDYALCLETLPSLRWVHVPWTGVEWLLKGPVADGRVLLTNSRGTAGIPVAEYAIAAVLAASKDLSLYRENQSRRLWSRRPSREVHGARLLVVGFGSIGKLVAKYARALGMKIDVVTRTPVDAGRSVTVYGPESVERALANADYVVSTLPATAQTHDYFGERLFAAMQPHAWFINVGRGDVVDEAALENALRTGTIAGAYLDVFGKEPLPEDSSLWDVPGLSATPHAASWTDGKFDRSFQLFVTNLKSFSAGSALTNVVDVDNGY
ncbi:D-2-hydroxyacid dehydrogenase (plasmid) [Rhizobium sp. NIBRBAC000502774]|nr:D-2-hydroxyacid dehydrogenase [Rhizobium sp. NIBRBAC000502774]